MVLDRLKIQDFSGFAISDGRVILADKNEYNLNSFSPIILNISPNSKFYLDEMDINDKIDTGLLLTDIVLLGTAYLAQGVAVGEDALTTHQNFLKISSVAAIGAGIVLAGLGFLYYRDWDLKQKLKETYNADLKRYYLPETSSIDQVVPAPSLELIEKTEQAASIP